MEIRGNRDEVIKVFRDALARDKTRTQVFDISELGLVEMTRKRIGEGLLESFSSLCPECEGRGVADRPGPPQLTDVLKTAEGGSPRCGNRTPVSHLRSF